MNEIRTSLSFFDLAKDFIVQALELTINEYLNILKDIIETEVYDAYYGDWAMNDMRTYELLDAWIIEPPMIENGYVEQELHFDLNKITLWFTQYQGENVIIHEDKFGKDGRDFPMMINDGIYNFGFAPKRPFWDSFINHVKQNFEKDFQRNLDSIVRFN